MACISSLASILSLLLSLSVTALGDIDVAPSLNASEDTFPLSGKSCCMRLPNNISLGLDENGTSVTVDVGKCVDICYSWVSGFAGLQQCNGECYAKRTTMKVFKLQTGEKEVSVIRSCRCGGAGRCRRLRKTVVYHPGTEHRVEVDVGQCSSRGGCGTDSCQVVHYDLKTIQSPKGTRNVPVVKTCKCVGGCHRLPHYEEVRMDGGQDVRPRGDGGEEGGSGEVTGQGEELEVPLALTVVDVGRCSSWTCPTPKPQCIP
ncbi:hypothetical protein GBAR_LOCUS26750 [Geodia barretti]|nr:hypothetical protein GBAR_LOCUS26750 [Geodia barretti]